jgi:hypothetical protein
MSKILLRSALALGCLFAGAVFGLPESQAAREGAALDTMAADSASSEVQPSSDDPETLAEIGVDKSVCREQCVNACKPAECAFSRPNDRNGCTYGCGLPPKTEEK